MQCEIRHAFKFAHISLTDGPGEERFQQPGADYRKQNFHNGTISLFHTVYLLCLDGLKPSSQNDWIVSANPRPIAIPAIAISPA